MMINMPSLSCMRHISRQERQARASSLRMNSGLSSHESQQRETHEGLHLAPNTAAAFHAVDSMELGAAC